MALMNKNLKEPAADSRNDMYAATIAYMLFNVFKHHYAAKADFIKPQMRMKNFTLHFVMPVAKWIKKSRQWVLEIYPRKDYQLLCVS